MSAPAAVTHASVQPQSLPSVERRPLSIRRDLLVTFGSELLVLACSFLALRMAAMAWGSDGFGHFVLARRALGWIQLPALLGMHLAMARFIAAALARHDHAEARRLLLTGSSLVITALVVVVMVLQLLARPLAFALLGDVEDVSTIRALSLAVAGLVLHTMSYGALRGRRNVRLANALQLMMLGVLPIAPFAWRGITIPMYLSIVGGVMLLGALLVVAWIERSESVVVAREDTGDDRAARWSRLLQFGLPRVPGELALGALFALPVVLAAHRGGQGFAGHVGIALSVLQLLGACAAPIGSTLLPVVSALGVGEVREGVRSLVIRSVVLAFAAAVVASATLAIITPWLLATIFGDAMTAASSVVRVVLVAAPAYITYVVLRSVLDALDVRALNARNMLAAVGCLVVVVLLDPSGPGIARGIVGAMWVLGVLTTIAAHRVMRRAHGLVDAVAAEGVRA